MYGKCEKWPMSIVDITFINLSVLEVRYFVTELMYCSEDFKVKTDNLNVS